jgi:valyl-tRNA synthetase
MDELSKPALENVMNDNIQFHPAKFKNSYAHWMENIRDWCISRQLWWGHRIPAWYFGEEPDDYVIARTENEAVEKAREKSGNTDLSSDDLHQDEDVLDTWFSSWLWPMSVFDGFRNPDNEEINYYYPTKDLVTAPEIMFFWVARMIMAGYYFRDEKPFSNVYFHGIVRDEQRRKMSKSLGNSPDPLDLIKQYGADGTRVGMLFASPAGNDLLFDENLCEQGRNFSNKIWNAFRFLMMNKQDGTTYSPTTEIDPENLADRWMMSRIKHTLAGVEQDFENYRLNEALKKIYSLVWDDFCDWYIEVSKADTPGELMPAENLERALGLFEVLMKMLHPFMPFLTEEIWQRIQVRSPEEALTISQWPELESNADDHAINLFSLIQEQVSAIRNIQSEMGLSPKADLDLYIKTTSKDQAEKLNEQSWIFTKFLSIESLEFNPDLTKPKASASALVKGTEIFVPLEGLIDLDKERERIQTEIKKTEGFLKSVEGKLSNEKFVENAPDDVVERERQKKADALSDIDNLKQSLENLG